MSGIYFHKDKFARAVGMPIQGVPDNVACRHRTTKHIFIDVGQLMFGYHRFFSRFPLDDKISACINHEVLHEVLEKYVGDYANNCLDTLTIKYWDRGIDIATNLEVEK